MELLTISAAKAEPSSLKRGEPATIRTARLADIPGIRALFQRSYKHEPPPYLESLSLAQRLFPEGQFVATINGEVVGYSSSLLLDSCTDDLQDDWNILTAWGTLANHKSEGDFLYAAEVLVCPEKRGFGIGRLFYAQRDLLAQNLLEKNKSFKGIAATARLSGYYKHRHLSPQEYLQRVINQTLKDPTLSFQLKQGFEVLNLKQDFDKDPETLGWAASIFKRFPPENKALDKDLEFFPCLRSST